MSHDVLFLPGPSECDAELREIMSMPLMGHRSARFIEEVNALLPKLRGLFLTEQIALFENCPATGMMDAAVRNLVHDRILHLTCGAFSERWHKSGVACGRTAEALAVEWGEAATPDMLRRHLEANPPYEAVTITYSETSTGVLNPLPELAAVVREVAPETLVLVDVVSAVAGAELRFDAWGLDFAMSGTQKCLALPPGLCVYALSERALAKAGQVEGRGFLQDFVKAKKGYDSGKTPATPNIPLVFALSRQLDRIAAEGLEARWARHSRMQAMTQEWAREHDFTYFSADGFQSPTVSAMRASGRDVSDLIAKAKAAGFVLGNGYGKLKNQTFRVGHMGDHPPERLAQLLAAIP
ncbi:MAG: aminotransferase class V-fold PLP-dependent enzyme [Planctomycetota bacterium]|nr:aminotransferase class V-fold PLP-dependent enzyme [Planctomycetota bacterium]